MSNLFYPIVISAIIITFYYYIFFSYEKIKQYSNTWYFIFIVHLIILYMWIMTEMYEILIDSPFDNPISIVTNIMYYTLTLLSLM